MKKYWIIGAIALVLFVGAYVGSPYFAVDRFRSAALSGDAEQLESHVDFPAVRESLKSQMTVQLTAAMNEDAEMKNDPFAGLGLMLIPTIVDRAIEAYVTPDGIAALMKSARSSKEGGTNNDTVSTSHYVDLDRFRVDFHPSGETSQKGSLTFERRGIFSWKLVRLKLPDNLLAQDTHID